MNPMYISTMPFYQQDLTTQGVSSRFSFKRAPQKYGLSNALLSYWHFKIFLLCLSVKHLNLVLDSHISSEEVRYCTGIYTSWIICSTLTLEILCLLLISILCCLSNFRGAWFKLVTWFLFPGLSFILSIFSLLSFSQISALTLKIIYPQFWILSMNVSCYW